MATIGEIRKALEGLPDDAVFGIRSMGEGITTSLVSGKIHVLTLNDGTKDEEVAIVLQQDKHDPCFLTTAEQEDLLDEG